MKIHLTDGIETLTVDTTILWYLKSEKSFDYLLTECLENLKAQGFKVIEDFSNIDAWEYIFCNLDKGERILA